jgi:putative RNA 2'-phosphotransferase
MLRNKAVTISKKLSYILRHNEDIDLDAEGWLDLKTAHKELKKAKKLAEVTVDDILEVSEKFDKKRFEIKGNKIRAKYGHSIEQKIVYDPAEPPESLYHGTATALTATILEEGLKKMDRQYVHLTHELDTAHSVGKRHSRKVVIFTISAKKAFLEGLEFYYSDGTWLVENVPAKYIGEILYV